MKRIFEPFCRICGESVTCPFQQWFERSEDRSEAAFRAYCSVRANCERSSEILGDAAKAEEMVRAG